MGRQLWWLYPRMTSVQSGIPWILDYTSCYFIQILTLLLISWLITINIHKHEEIWLVVPILKRVGFTYTGTISLRIKWKEWRCSQSIKTKKKKSYRITVHHLHPSLPPPPVHKYILNWEFSNSRLKNVFFLSLIVDTSTYYCGHLRAKSIRIYRALKFVR